MSHEALALAALVVQWLAGVRAFFFFHNSISVTRVGVGKIPFDQSYAICAHDTHRQRRPLAAPINVKHPIAPLRSDVPEILLAKAAWVQSLQQREGIDADKVVEEPRHKSLPQLLPLEHAEPQEPTRVTPSMRHPAGRDFHKPLRVGRVGPHPPASHFRDLRIVHISRKEEQWRLGGQGGIQESVLGPGQAAPELSQAAFVRQHLEPCADDEKIDRRVPQLLLEPAPLLLAEHVPIRHPVRILVVAIVQQDDPRLLPRRAVGPGDVDALSSSSRVAHGHVEEVQEDLLRLAAVWEGLVPVVLAVVVVVPGREDRMLRDEGPVRWNAGLVSVRLQHQLGELVVVLQKRKGRRGHDAVAVDVVS
mmetsp:Transcript_12149/g.45065  ORF Transcript_12149/g.45065 Transcript_12149/m.45065 type:complete len:362 (+) Transcript_12149:172-1257(+)|eukprot:scaffold1638_cov258-Pinguiococcus_pyrenoidosus.AAC.36